MTPSWHLGQVQASRPKQPHLPIPLLPHLSLQRRPQLSSQLGPLVKVRLPQRLPLPPQTLPWLQSPWGPLHPHQPSSQPPIQLAPAHSQLSPPLGAFQSPHSPHACSPLCPRSSQQQHPGLCLPVHQALQSVFHLYCLSGRRPGRLPSPSQLHSQACPLGSLPNHSLSLSSPRGPRLLGLPGGPQPL